MDHTALVERVVAEVMSNLMAGARSRDESKKVVVAPRVGISLADSVITEELLIEKAKGQRIVEVFAKAIVTPSAKDWLRHNQVELRRTALSSKRPTAQVNRLAIVQSGGSVAIQVIEDARKAAVSHWNREIVSSAEEAAKLAVNTICRGEATSVAVFSDQPEKVACLANRNEQAQAAAVFSVADVERVRGMMGCNIFIIGVSSKSAFELLRILRKVEVVA